MFLRFCDSLTLLTDKVAKSLTAVATVFRSTHLAENDDESTRKLIRIRSYLEHLNMSVLHLRIYRIAFLGLKVHFQSGSPDFALLFKMS